MILRPVRPVSPCGPPTTKRPVGIDVVLGLRNPPCSDGTTGSMMCFFTSRAQLFGGNVGAVLRGNHHRLDALGHVAHVFHADLALAVGPQEVQHALAAHLGKPPHQLVRHHDGQRHQLGRFVAGVAEHQALVAGAAGIHAHGDIGRLRLDQVEHAAGVANRSRRWRRCSPRSRWCRARCAERPRRSWW